MYMLRVALGGWKRILRLLDLELQVVMSFQHECSKQNPGSLQEQQIYLPGFVGGGFRDRVLLYIPDCPQTSYVAHIGFRLSDLSALALGIDITGVCHHPCFMVLRRTLINVIRQALLGPGSGSAG